MSTSPPKVGISLASLLPLSAWGDPFATITQAGRLGYNFVQSLPLKGFGQPDRRLAQRLAELPIPIRYCESAWNNWRSIGQVATNHLLRRAGPGYPRLLDYMFFPPESQSEALELTLSQTAGQDGSLPYLISHSFQPETDNRAEAARQLVEVHRGLGLTVEEIIDRCNRRQQRRCLVIDTHHLRMMGGWESTLPRLLPCTRAVHVAPLRNTPRGQLSELDRCLAGKPTELGEMMEMIAYATPDPPFDYIVEATLGEKGVFQPGEIGPTMREIRHWVEEALKV